MIMHLRPSKRPRSDFATARVAPDHLPCATSLSGRLRLEGLCAETALVIGTRSEADEIVAYAAEHGCDLIAMASDSRPWYRRLIGGSPDTAVLRKATVPTLFVGEGTRKAPVARVAPRANAMMAILGSAEL